MTALFGAVLTMPHQVRSESDASLTPEVRAQVIERIAQLLTENYVFEEVASKCAERLRQRLRSGAYDKLADLDSLARTLTGELRTAANDTHMEVTVAQPPPPANGPPQDPRAWVEDLRRRNFDFYKLERLSGNVGYLELRSFPPVEVAGDAAETAMSFLANSDAVIIDLRRNGGGTGEMVNLLSSYFFERQTLLSVARRRGQEREDQAWTLNYVHGKRMPGADVYLLTSEATFSAAEGFAYQLQALGRAKVVGERTRGGANPGKYLQVNERLRIFVPNVQVVSPATGKNWEGIGVQPDLFVPADRALAVAHAEALKRLLQKATDDSRKRELTWALEALQGQAKPLALSTAVLRSYAGSYGSRKMSYVDGRLRFQRDGGPPFWLIAVAEDTFLLDGVDRVRLQIVRGSGDRATKLQVLYADGEEVLAERDR